MASVTHSCDPDSFSRPRNVSIPRKPVSHEVADVPQASARPLRHAMSALVPEQEQRASVDDESDPCLHNGSQNGADKQPRTDGQPPRTPVQNLGPSIFSLLVGLLPTYFLVFAGLAIKNDSTTVASRPQASWLLEAAKYGPTVFPIMFAAIVGQLMTALGAWALERAVTVGLLESLLASRSLASVVVSLFKLRIFTVWTPLILFIWCLSPLGGQASLRIVRTELFDNASSRPIFYLDTNAGYPITMDLADSDAEGTTTPNTWTARSAFAAALASSATSKNGSQDMFGNLQIPMLSSLNTAAPANGWTNITGHDYVHAALFGIPLAQIPAEVNSSFTIQSSYLALDCSVDSKALNYTATQSTPKGAYTMWNVTGGPETPLYHGLNMQGSDVSGRVFGYTAVDSIYCQDHESIADLDTIRPPSANWTCFTARLMDTSPSHYYNTTVPRRIGLQSFAVDSQTPNQTVATEAWCDMRTIYVDVKAECVGGISNCTATSIRESLSPPWTETATFLDAIGFMNRTDFAGEDNSWTIFYGGPRALTEVTAWLFFSGLMRTANPVTEPGYSALEQFFLTPNVPASGPLDGYGNYGPPIYNHRPIADIGSELFSRRFAPILNTWWLAAYVPYAVITGSTSSENTVYNITQNNPGARQGNRIGANITTAVTHEVEVVLRYSRIWAAILIIISTLLVVAGIAGFTLDVLQKAPSVLDYFVSCIRYNEHAVVGGSTKEDGADMARRLRKEIVQIGDIRPNHSVGSIAVVMTSASQPIEQMRRRRKYA
ncbi:hypothetical protein AC578_5939 [Pseudocercospora eumusae]|uniref:Uncharacterized protein n=1 Tax=Pseudocercospora eumusae TaxID=321146 RepID=A0A139HIE5_9PEZI|nr:hypothetical protein AC578_5939 [Pseudocercospora eumusae]